MPHAASCLPWCCLSPWKAPVSRPRVLNFASSLTRWDWRGAMVGSLMLSRKKQRSQTWRTKVKRCWTRTGWRWTKTRRGALVPLSAWRRQWSARTKRMGRLLQWWSKYSTRVFPAFPPGPSWLDNFQPHNELAISNCSSHLMFLHCPTPKCLCLDTLYLTVPFVLTIMEPGFTYLSGKPSKA